MLKFAILLFNTLALLIYQLFIADGITVTQNVPATAKPDTEFTIELTIKKGSTGGFAKLQQELPAGFTAVEDKNNGASFTFSNQMVKFIWMSLPNDQEFKISYKVKVADGISGDQVIGGKFSYVTDNVKQTADIEPSTINVEGTGGTTASTETPTTETATTETAITTTETPTETATTETATTETPTETATTSSSSNGDSSPFSCVRTLPGSASDEFVVEITVNKANLTGFAKLMEVLPTGFTATGMETSGASFSFADQKARFIWVSLPAQPEFKISYKVKVKNVGGDQLIDGVFSYIENDDTKKYVMPTDKITIGEGGDTPIVKNKTPENTDNSNNDNQQDNGLNANNIPSPQVGVEYKVQIMALQRNRAASEVAKIYNMATILVEKRPEQGLNKYLLTSSHTEYKNARDSRENIKSKGVVSPFVVAYNKGRRIPVQDALMISNSKWVR
ncbi:MAG: hypothetical protein V4608_16005 [Bacteroidota bacterium]